MLTTKMLWKRSVFASSWPHLVSLSTPAKLKGFKFRRYRFHFKFETANERPCKSCMEFVLAKDYRDTFPELSSSSWIVHWCRKREPENPNITLWLFFSFPRSCCSKKTALLHNVKGKWLKRHLIHVVSIQKESKLIYCSSDGWKTAFLNVIKNLISAPSPNKSIRNMVVTNP